MTYEESLDAYAVNGRAQTEIQRDQASATERENVRHSDAMVRIADSQDRETQAIVTACAAICDLCEFIKQKAKEE